MLFKSFIFSSNVLFNNFFEEILMFQKLCLLAIGNVSLLVFSTFFMFKFKYDIVYKHHQIFIPVNLLKGSLELPPPESAPRHKGHEGL